MEIVYRRELSCNYMVVRKQEEHDYNYQMYMMTRNKINGFLNLSVRQIDDVLELYYEISSKQPLNRFLENRKIGVREIYKIVMGISTALSNMKPYLLQENQIYLMPEQIYVEPDSFDIYLCLIPGNERDFLEDLKSFVRMLLDYVDYQNKESVEILYGIYHETLKDNFQLTDFLKHLPEGQETDKTLASILIKQPELEELKEYQVDVKLPQKTEEFQNENNLYSYFDKLTSETKSKAESTTNFFENFKAFLGLGAKKVERQTVVEKACDKDIDSSKHWNYQNVTEDLSVVREHSVGETVLLEHFQKDAKRMMILKSISPLIYADILVDVFPFIIGKGIDGIHYSINHPAISRYHLSIDCIDGNFQVQDLNSLNGSCINGVLLAANETKTLSHGDLIEMAGMEFYFYNQYQI